ncbi:MAG: hypothetical protein N2442_12945 [Spirochaetes bacterium]|nr:hypothetical protein [Spirochaetota bacterium]
MQFRELFRDTLYFDLALHANRTASRIAEAFKKHGVPFLAATETNQIFPILSERVIEQLLSKYEFYRWKRIDENHSAVRFVTSWATPERVVDEFIQLFLSIRAD